jgi:hypothetical protein
MPLAPPFPYFSNQAGQAEMNAFPEGSRKKHCPGCELTGPTNSGFGAAGASGAGPVVLHPERINKAKPTTRNDFISTAPFHDAVN